jgi:hypothetical protein
MREVLYADSQDTLVLSYTVTSRFYTAVQMVAPVPNIMDAPSYMGKLCGEKHAKRCQ